MSAPNFTAWLAHMGLNDTKAAEQLGCGRNSIRIWRQRGAPRYIALACAALSFGLPPWTAR